MAKQGQHNNDAHDPDKSKGNNHPDRSQTITTGSYKKQETYEQQAREHKDTSPRAQAATHEWNEDSRAEPTTAGSTRARNPRSGRSGSDSNAGRDTRGH
jgi:hypothetical protein